MGAVRRHRERDQPPAIRMLLERHVHNVNDGMRRACAMSTVPTPRGDSQAGAGRAHRGEGEPQAARARQEARCPERRPCRAVLGQDPDLLASESRKCESEFPPSLHAWSLRSVTSPSGKQENRLSSAASAHPALARLIRPTTTSRRAYCVCIQASSWSVSITYTNLSSFRNHPRPRRDLRRPPEAAGAVEIVLATAVDGVSMVAVVVEGSLEPLSLLRPSVRFRKGFSSRRPVF